MQLAIGLSLIEMSLEISKSHNNDLDYEPLIGICQSGINKALEYLENDHQVLVEYRIKKDSTLLLQSTQQQLELTIYLIEQLHGLENEVYLLAKADYLAGINSLTMIKKSLLNNYQMTM